METSTGAVQPKPSLRESQIPTSFSPSSVPANQAATRPPGVCSMVEAWQPGKGARSKMNSLWMSGDMAGVNSGSAAGILPGTIGERGGEEAGAG